MKITIQPDTGSPYELADHGHTSPADLRINGETVAEVAEYLRATAVDVFDRGNRRITVSFSVTREHDTVEAAQEYILTHELSLPRRGRIEFEYEQQRGMCWIYDAVITSASGSHIGCTTVIQYNILGGQVSDDNPYASGSNLIA